MMVFGPPSITLKSEGTANRDGSGSARTMLVNRNVCSPIRGSFRLLETIVLRSVEVQTSVTILMGRSLPTWPAGMDRVVRTPFTTTPSIVWEPRDSVFASSCPSVAKCFVWAIIGGGGGGGSGGIPPSVCTKNVPEPTDAPGAPFPAGGLGFFHAVLSVKFSV